MRLSAPIHQLKRQARLTARAEQIPLHLALDRIAAREGFASWSLLARTMAEQSPASRLFSRLRPGDMVLVGARPGQGKTLFSLELCIEAMKMGRQAAFFSLEYTERDIVERFRTLDADPIAYSRQFLFDCSDGISADYVWERMAPAAAGTVIAIDYLQLLDQKRDKPPLEEQIAMFRRFANRKGVILVFISQIDRQFDPNIKAFPDIDDIRLPNPLNLSLFNRMCFLNNRRVEIHAAH